MGWIGFDGRYFDHMGQYAAVGRAEADRQRGWGYTDC
jgi:hypothetical protein